MRYLTKREIRNELFGILAMIDGFGEVGQVCGLRKIEMITYLPKEIARSIMRLQDKIDSSILQDRDGNENIID